MKIVGLGLLLLASSAFAKPAVVDLNGKQYHTGYLKKPNEGTAVYYAPKVDFSALPESYDAREHGRVTSIKSQGSCGSCWAFSRTKALEAAMITAGRSSSDSLDLAEQDTLVNDHTAYGCDGGFMDGEFEKNSGVTTEDKCPYRASDSYACRGAKYGKATSWAMIGQSNRKPTVDELRQAIVDYGVISVTVAAGGNFEPNSQGRITSCGDSGINHMVTLVAYRPASNGGYEFLIGNSWGEEWGDAGYAWSKQGCNQLASDPGEAALFFYVQGNGFAPEPVELGLPKEIVVKRGEAATVRAVERPGVSYTWSNGVNGSHTVVRANEDMRLTLEATDAFGTTTASVKVRVVD